jgi:hypothetical protein
MLTGNESWIVSGDEIYCKGFPVVHVELDCELIKIDVMGQVEILHLHDEPLTIGYKGEVIEDVYATPELLK